MRLAQAFLAYGVDPDYARKLDGRTALMITPELASRGFKDAEALARLLIRCGADVQMSVFSKSGGPIYQAGGPSSSYNDGDFQTKVLTSERSIRRINVDNPGTE